VLPTETVSPVRPRPHAAYPLLRAVFYVVWVGLLPGVVSVLLVDALEPPQGGPPVSALRTLVGDQKIPFGILFFTVLAIAIYRARTKLPLAELCGIGGRRDVPNELQGRFEDASALVEEARRILRSRRKEIARELLVAEQEELERGLVALEVELAADPFQPPQFERAHLHATRLVGEHLGRWRKGEIREYAEAIAFAISVALLLRGFVFEAFKIPSGSMIPTLLVGDHIFVNKFAYGPLLPYSDKRLFRDLPPDRADVIVFKYPENPEQDFIKRVIAIPGDSFAVVDGRPVINGWPVPTCHVGPFKQESDREGRTPQQLYVEFLDDRAYLTLQRAPVPEQTCATNADCPRETSCYYGLCGRDGKEYTVKPGEVWVLGDARDNSHDSRSWNRGNGAGVPFDNIKGRAMFVFATFGPSGSMFHRFLVDVMGKPRLPLANAALQPALERCLREMPKSTHPPPPSKPARAK
jgi:signal peptidase I